MITVMEALRLAQERLAQKLPPSTVYTLSVADGFFSVKIHEADRNALSSLFHLDDTSNKQMQDAVERYVQELYKRIDAEHGPIVLPEEYAFLQRLRCPAMLLISEDDCTLLARALSPDESANYTGWSDNGGDPDGPSCLLWTCDDMLIAYAKRLGISYQVVYAFELSCPLVLSRAYAKRGLAHLRDHWSGIASEECILAVGERDAVWVMRLAREIALHPEVENELPDDLLEQLISANPV